MFNEGTAVQHFPYSGTNTIFYSYSPHSLNVFTLVSSSVA